MAPSFFRIYYRQHHVKTTDVMPCNVADRLPSNFSEELPALMSRQLCDAVINVIYFTTFFHLTRTI